MLEMRVLIQCQEVDAVLIETNQPEGAAEVHQEVWRLRCVPEKFQV